MKKQTEDIFEPAIPVVPQGWDVLPFEQAIDVISDKSKRVKQSAYLSSGKLAVIDQGQDFVGGYTDDEDLAFEGELPVILFGDHTRSIKYVDKPFAVGAEGVKILKPSGGFDPKYFYYLLRSLHIPSRGYSRHFQFLRKFHFPRAPEGQQKRIVAEIEKQFSRLDEAVANLKRVKANLKRYKAAVLKAAVEGRLVETEAERARREGRSFETGAQLLQRILETRRSQWQGKVKYKEPAAPDTTDLPELPEGWVWATVEQLADVQLGKMLDRKKHQSGNELPYLRNINVRWDSVDSSDLLTMFFKDTELDRYGLHAGDVLVCEGGEPGRAAIWDGRISGMMYQKAIHRVRFKAGYEQKLLVFYLEFLAKTGRLERWFTGSTIKHFTRESFAQLPIPVAPVSEQRRIIMEIDRRLTHLRETESQVDVNLQRAARLRQTILGTVFSGRMQVCTKPPNNLLGLSPGSLKTGETKKNAAA
jgi:type I restriction enzyme S subunit